MFTGVLGWARRFNDRIEENGARHGLAYPGWIPIFSACAQVGFVVLAAAQRDLLLPPSVGALAVLLVAVPQIVHLAFHMWTPWWLISILVLLGTTWLLVGPATTAYHIAAPAGVLTFLAAEVTSTDGAKAGFGVTAASVAVLVSTGDFDFATVFFIDMVFIGFVIGVMLRRQMRSLTAERAARAGERERATLAERQRIAREIHDLVGHSLSVTLLHVTGARRALTEDGDVTEAVDSLRDAERIGREAMTDIRRTVGVLAADSEDRKPLPTATDIDGLVSEVRSAGLAVDYHATGDLTRLSPAAGLGLYRVAQESLANVAKHAPTTPARVRVVVEPAEARLSVRNDLNGTSTEPDTQGSGLDGMASRAEQLGGSFNAGTRDGHWQVDLTIPISRPAAESPTAADDHDCLVRRIVP